MRVPQASEVAVLEMPPLRLAALPHRGPYPSIAGAFDRLLGWAKESGLKRPDTRWFGRYLDDPVVVPAAELRSEACMTLPAGSGIEAGAALPLQWVELPAMRVAVLRFQGPYSELHRAYDVLLQK